MTETFDISLKDARFHAHHGVFEQETAVGNEFRVNLTVRIDASNFDADGDDLTGTLSYADLYEVIRQEMANTARLLETVCVRTARRLRRDFPLIQSGEIEIIKVAPPIPGIVGSTGVKYYF